MNGKWKHGEYYTYVHKRCRCAECMAANATYKRLSYKNTDFDQTFKFPMVDVIGKPHWKFIGGSFKLV